MTKRPAGGFDSGGAGWTREGEARGGAGRARKLDVEKISKVNRSGSLKCFKSD